MPDYAFEEALAAGGGPVVGVDEAGRGPWAGPVVAAAVWLDPARLSSELLRGLDDSKKLTKARRAALFEALAAAARADPTAAAFAVADVGVAEIDRNNILRASLDAMARAVARLDFRPEAALIDGNRAPALPCRTRTLVGGDGRSLSVAAASIVAKVTRDGIMTDLAAAHPGYGWERNAGYGTAEHRAAIARLGVTPQHRHSFRPIREALSLKL
jgi:ribonuclease HII